MDCLFTIGYSWIDINEFPSILHKYNINVIVDVRSVPYSQRFPDFNRESLKNILKRNKINYIFMGKEFGARRNESDVYHDGVVDFSRVFQSKLFLEGVKRVEKGLKDGYTISFLCSEKDPLDCHRTIMISQYFSKIGLKICHIIQGSKLITQRDIENELLQKHFKKEIGQRSLFDDVNDLLSKAYEKQNTLIGYKKEGDEYD